MPRPLLVAEGGNLRPDSPHGRSLLARMVAHAKANAGRAPVAVVLGALDHDDPDERPAAFERAGCASARGLVIAMGQGDDPDKAGLVEAADILFLRGGDQSRYVNFWRGTRTEAAIRSVLARGGVIAGTSAGCAILGEHVFDARVEGLSPREALADAHHANLTLTHGFLGFSPGILYDTHFVERGRLARLALMLARLAEKGHAGVLGVGVDASTAAVSSPGGPDDSLEVVGAGPVCLLKLGAASRRTLDPGRPPTITDLRLDHLAPGSTFDPAGAVRSRPKGVAPATHPDHLAESAFEPIRVEGADPACTRAGLWSIVAPKGPDAPPETFEPGEGRVPAILLPALWSKSAIAPALTAAFSRLALDAPPPIIALDAGAALDIDASGIARVVATARPTDEDAAGPTSAPTAAMVIDPRGLTFAGAAPGLASRERDAESVVPHAEGLVLHVLAPGWGFDLSTREVVSP